MSRSKTRIQNSKFSFPRYYHFTAKSGLFLVQVVGESMNRRDSRPHRSIRLEPDSMDSNFKLPTLDPDTVNELRVVEEFVGITSFRPPNIPPLHSSPI